ncbi:transaldolase [Allomuricauda sp. d1]|uniref:transaldolase n=1 Tax=Allomuricauda sp. d1 TaxID=3136725 RepID=UPI0031DEB39B
MTKLLLALLLLFTFSCGKNDTAPQAVYFGGEIVNPTSDHVVLYRNDAVVDSAKLDENHRFSFNLNNIEEGLYHFDHKPELQYIYLEDNDSVLIRLNTVDFDESLVFSGEGSEINNFLIEMFLAFENERPLIYKYYKLDPEVFSAKVDSLRNDKLTLLEELKADGNLSEKALEIAKASIDYNSFIYKEKYPFYHKKRTGEKAIHLSENFYNYRTEIDLNNVNLAYFKPYYDFMLYHLGNVAYMTCKKNCGTHVGKHDNLLHFNRHKLKLVDSLVVKEELRDILFRNIAMNYLLKEHQTNDESQKFIDEFCKLSKSDEHKEEINYLYKGIKRLQPNSELPNLIVLDTAGRNISLQEIAENQKTVFYFWTGSQKMHFNKIINRVAHLKDKHSEYQFVGINIRTSEDQWMLMMKTAGLDPSKQYRSDEFGEMQHALVIDGLDKCVIAKDKEVIDGFANLYHSF